MTGVSGMRVRGCAGVGGWWGGGGTLKDMGRE